VGRRTKKSQVVGKCLRANVKWHPQRSQPWTHSRPFKPPARILTPDGEEALKTARPKPAPKDEPTDVVAKPVKAKGTKAAKPAETPDTGDSASLDDLLQP
jgi:hypothetical protein